MTIIWLISLPNGCFLITNNVNWTLNNNIFKLPLALQGSTARTKT